MNLLEHMDAEVVIQSKLVIAKLADEERKRREEQASTQGFRLGDSRGDHHSEQQQKQAPTA